MDDAIIEDTVHCSCCGCSFMLGGNDYVLLDGADIRFRDGCSGAFCVECAAAVHKAYGELLREMGICEHGIEEGDWCESCNAEYKRARKGDGIVEDLDEAVREVADVAWREREGERIDPDLPGFRIGGAP